MKIASICCEIAQPRIIPDEAKKECGAKPSGCIHGVGVDFDDAERGLMAIVEDEAGWKWAIPLPESYRTMAQSNVERGFMDSFPKCGFPLIPS